jgi:hypothetical protein
MSDELKQVLLLACHLSLVTEIKAQEFDYQSEDTVEKQVGSRKAEG